MSGADFAPSIYKVRSAKNAIRSIYFAQVGLFYGDPHKGNGANVQAYQFHFIRKEFT
jgi:hypothetical protein